MKIEVASKKDDSTKDKGDLFENLCNDLLNAQSYEVIEEIRVTGAELDLLCKHRVSGKQIYVECKAQKEKISAKILRQLLGTVTGYDHAEGWIVSTSEFGKEAKGFVEMWKEKPADVSGKLSFYSPDLVVESLQNASVICAPPVNNAQDFVGDAEFLGEWTLLVSQFGRFWAVYTLQGGAPYGVLIYNAKNGRHIRDKTTISNLAQLETSLADYDLSAGLDESDGQSTALEPAVPSVVEVQIGDSWDDYRPARPQDFVGRDATQKEILAFFGNAKDKTSDTRIFAITGNSGLGKSSLIAKVRDRSRNKFYKNRFFTFAVDVRGAKTPSYISASLMKCLTAAQKAGFGDPIDLQLTDPSSPLTSPTIAEYLLSLEESNQVVCLVFDQFEELYSQPELFGVFTAAKDLMLDVASQKRNFILGFAWKTDSTTQQDHPAYHMWHDLADHRRVYKLDVFDSGEISKSITTFEKEIGSKVPIETRHQIANASQGFPWLLKKLCINLYENLKKGEGAESLLVDLDVRRLFESDLELLSQAELTCLKIIAQKAPADWSEIIEISGVAVLNSLVHKRLVVRSGDRLNVYWDIFKDYLLSGKVPIIPFNYVPVSDITSMLNVFGLLKADKFVSSDDIAKATSLNERTVWNIGADLVMFGLAERSGTTFKYHRDLDEISETAALQKLREKFGKHALKLAIYKSSAGKTVDKNTIKATLKSCLPKASFSDRTWVTYTNRLSNFLTHTGYFVRAGANFVVQDLGTPVVDRQNLGRQGKLRGVVFSASASPAAVVEALSLIDGGDDIKSLEAKGYRNALSVLKRFDLVAVIGDTLVLNKASIKKYGGHLEAVWTSAKNEATVAKGVRKITQEPDITGFELGQFISDEYARNWTPGSIQRNGNGLKQWSIWVRGGVEGSEIPTPPGRSK